MNLLASHIPSKLQCNLILRTGCCLALHDTLLTLFDNPLHRVIGVVDMATLPLSIQRQ